MMRKRVISLALALVMLMALAACGNVKGDISTPEPEDGLSVGTATGSVYKSEFLGIGYELDSGWTFADQERILELNQLGTDVRGEELDEQASELETFIDMFAEDPLGVNNLQVAMTNIGFLSGLIHDAGDYIDEEEEPLAEAMEAMGMEDVKTERLTMVFAGAESEALRITGSYMGFNVYQTMVCVMRGNYFVCVLSTCFIEDDCEEMLAKFYALD